MFEYPEHPASMKHCRAEFQYVKSHSASVPVPQTSLITQSTSAAVKTDS